MHPPCPVPVLPPFTQPDALVNALMGAETERLLQKFDFSPTSKFGGSTVYDHLPEDTGAWGYLRTGGPPPPLTHTHELSLKQWR